MTLPVSPNTITFNDVNVELSKSGTAAISLNDTQVRRLANKTSGAIAFSDLHGQTATITTFGVGDVGPGYIGYYADQWHALGLSITKGTFKGSQILEIVTSAPATAVYLYLDGTHASSYVRRMEVAGRTYLTSDANFSLTTGSHATTGPFTRWAWTSMTGTYMMATGNEYTAEIYG